MRIGLLGGLRVEHDGRVYAVSGAMQLAVLFRLAVDSGTAVSYRAIAEDIWGMDSPENTKAALQSIVSRLRSQLPRDVIESTTGGYRLAVARSDVDALAFQDLVAAAEVARDASAQDAAALASDALALWAGEPWIPSDNFDWFIRDLATDHARALELGGSVARTRRSPRLPAQLTSLIGREVELGIIADQLEANRLVTIIGTGGAGKTRLAIEAAGEQESAILVELAPVGASEILNAVLTATGREIRMAEPTSELTGIRDRVVDALRGRNLLLVVDNCEHVIDAAAEIVQDLLTELPQLRILATSREPLGVPGEAFVGVGSLPHPTTAQIESLGVTELESFAALELFCQRASSARGSALNEDEVRDAARICSRLDGLPLAIELAAAKLRTMTVPEVLAGLEDRFSLLTGGYRTALPRHQTLRAMIDWSWSLLSDHERKALLFFAVFPAGLSVNESRSLAGRLRISDPAVFDALVDRSLLQRSRGRFRALETVREYGVERLSESGTLVDALVTQAEFMTVRAREMDRTLRGPRIMDAIEWFDAEEDNLTSALRYATGAPLPELAVTLVLSSAWYWVVRDRNEEARMWFDLVAPLAWKAEGDEARIIALIGTALSSIAVQDGQQMQDLTEEMRAELGEFLTALQAIPIGPGSHDLVQLVIPFATTLIGAMGPGEWMTTIRLPEMDELNLDAWPTAMVHLARAAMAQNRGVLPELGAESSESLTLFGELGDLWGIALSEQMKAIWFAAMGRLEEALELSDSSTEHMRSITSSWDLTQQQGLAVQMLARLGRTSEAAARAQKMVDDAEEGGNGRTILQANINAAQLEVQLGEFTSATSRIAVVEESRGAWPQEPPQLTAMIEGLKGSIACQQGELDVAEAHLRIAADAAVRSQDQPVIGAMAITVGSYALARGNVALAVRAVDFSTAMIGAYDATHPEVVAIDEAARLNGIRRPSTTVPERPITLASLEELLGS